MVSPDERLSGSQNMVIMGCDDLGASVATALSEQGNVVHVLDSRSEAFERLPPGKIEDGHIVPFLGTGLLQRDLLRASIRDADVFMALSSIDARNAFVGQMAKHIFRVPVVICRIEDPTKQQMYTELDLVAVSGSALVTQMIVEAANK